MPILPKSINRISEIHIKKTIATAQFYRDFGRKFLILVWKNKISRIAKRILNNKSTSRGITIPDFKLHYRGIVNKQTTKHSIGKKWIH